MTMFIHFFCLCPLSLTIKLNFDISKVVYCSGRVNLIAVAVVVLRGSQCGLAVSRKKAKNLTVRRKKIKNVTVSRKINGKPLAVQKNIIAN